jgi:hypothetical protein
MKLTEATIKKILEDFFDKFSLDDVYYEEDYYEGDEKDTEFLRTNGFFVGDSPNFIQEIPTGPNPQWNLYKIFYFPDSIPT